MEISEFRRAGHELVDWMADYLRDVERLPVTARRAARRHPPRAPRIAAAAGRADRRSS